MTRALELIAQLRASGQNGKPHFEARPLLTLPTDLTAARST